MFRKLMVVLMAAALLVCVSGCEKDTPAKKVGRELEKVSDSIKDKFKN